MDFFAPAHVVEPRLAAVSELYLDLGQYYDRAALAGLGPTVRRLNDACGAAYRGAYRLLAAAGNAYAELLAAVETEPFLQKAEKRARGILLRELPRANGRRGRARPRFLNAVTRAGRVTLQDETLAPCGRVFELRDGLGLSHRLLARLNDAALERGLDTVPCLDPLASSRLLQLLIPSLDLAFAATDAGHPLAAPPVRRLWIDRMSETARSPAVRRLTALLNTLCDEAVERLARAGALHDELEAVYNPHVDFDAVHGRAEALIAAALA